MAGALTLRCGARSTLSFSLVALAFATAAFAEASGFPGLLSARALQGVASAALMSGGLTLVAQTHAPAARSAAIAAAQAGLGVGAGLGPVLGGVLLESVGRRATFRAAAALVLLNGLGVIALGSVLPAPIVGHAAEPGAAEPPAQQLRALLRHRGVAVVACSILLQYAAGGCFDATFGLHLRERFGIGPARASLIFSLEPLAYLVTMSILAPRVARASKPRYAAIGLGLTALSLPALPAGGRRASVTVATVIHGVGYGFKDVACHGLLAQLVERAGVGSFAMAFSLADMADSVGYVVGPPLGSLLCHYFGRTGGLFLFGLGVSALVPALARVEC